MIMIIQAFNLKQTFKEMNKLDLVDSIYDNKDFIGSFLFLASILFLLYLLINPANDLLIHIDEQFTLGLIQLPFNDAWKLICSDVHPPLYYLILIAGCGVLNCLHINYDIIFACKMLSLLPLLLILIVSVTKIRRDYGLFTMGVFAFTITTMSYCLIEFLTIRMYGWAMFFLLMAFIYYADILKKPSRKSWILFTAFSILCTYTHYYLLISLAVLYLLYPVYLYLDKWDLKKNMKKWALSILACIIFYIPWILTFISQVITTNNSYAGVKSAGIDTYVNYLTFFVLKQTPHLTDVMYTKILIGLFFILLVAMLILNRSRFRRDENYYIFTGLAVYIVSVLLGAFILNSTFRAFDIRYILPAVVVFWFAISVLLGKVNTKRLLVIALLFIMVLGTVGILMTNDTLTSHSKEGFQEKYFLNSINNQDNVVIYNSSYHYNCYHHALNNTHEYTLKNLNLPYDVDNCIYEENLTKILEDNPDKDVYLWRVVNKKSDINISDEIDATRLVGRGKIWLVNLEFSEEDYENETEEY